MGSFPLQRITKKRKAETSNTRRKPRPTRENVNKHWGNVRSESAFSVGSGRARRRPSLSGRPPGTDFGNIFDGCWVFFQRVSTDLQASGEIVCSIFLAPVEQKLGRKKGETPIIQLALVAPCILLASGTASEGRVPAPPEDTSLN